jgi:hypothetical protein
MFLTLNTFITERNTTAFSAAGAIYFGSRKNKQCNPTATGGWNPMLAGFIDVARVRRTVLQFGRPLNYAAMQRSAQQARGTDHSGRDSAALSHQTFKRCSCGRLAHRLLSRTPRPLSAVVIEVSVTIGPRLSPRKRILAEEGLDLGLSTRDRARSLQQVAAGSA